jgi:hypothetical protein
LRGLPISEKLVLEVALLSQVKGALGPEVSKHACPCDLKVAGIYAAQRARQLDDGMQVDVPAVSIGTTSRLYMHMAVTPCYDGADKVPTA